MVLSTGKVAFTIEFDNGDKQNIYFNPNDKKIMDRIKSFESEVNKKIQALDFKKYENQFEGGIDFDFSDTEKLFDLSVEEMENISNKLNAIGGIEGEYNQAIKEEIDIVFNSKISEVAFKYCEPLDVVVLDDNSREMYIMLFLRWLMEEIKKYGLKNSQDMEKHIAKYQKK